MKFLVLMAEAEHFANWERADVTHQERVAADFEAFVTAVSARGTIVLGEALAEPTAARTIRPGPERPATEGPYAETAEQLGGVWVIDVPALADAVDLGPRRASRTIRRAGCSPRPAARSWTGCALKPSPRAPSPSWPSRRT